MDDTVLLLLLVVLGALLVAIVVFLLMQFRHRFGAEKEPLLGDLDIQKEKTEAKSAKDSRKRGILIVASNQYEFYYDRSKEKDVVRLLELIKQSLLLLKETKYKDIIASRAKEGEALIKQLPSETSFTKADVDEILISFRNYVKTLG